MKISVADFSVSIGASIFKFGVHFQVGKVYCVNGNKDAKAPAKAHFAFLFNFSFCRSYIKHMDVFRQNFDSNYLI